MTSSYDSIPHNDHEKEVLEAFAKMQGSFEELSKRAETSFLDFASWIAKRHNSSRIHDVIKMQAMRRKLWLSTAKDNALGKLIEIALNGVNASNMNAIRAADIQRKACVDILRLSDWRDRVSTVYHRSDPSRNPPPPPDEKEPTLEELERSRDFYDVVIRERKQEEEEQNQRHSETEPPKPTHSETKPSKPTACTPWVHHSDPKRECSHTPADFHPRMSQQHIDSQCALRECARDPPLELPLEP